MEKNTAAFHLGVAIYSQFTTRNQHRSRESILSDRSMEHQSSQLMTNDTFYKTNPICSFYFDD